MIIIVDYGMGNLNSVKKKLDSLGVASCISSDPEMILKADKLILPGVGHFGKAMENLQKLGLIDVLNEAVLVKKTPILGICLGMQLMTKWSEEVIEHGTWNMEHGVEKGLGWFDAEVVKFKVNDTLRFKVPQTGWNSISIEKQDPLLEGIGPDSEFYFVHSYFVKANSQEDILTITEFEEPFVSGISKGNIYGLQFHPEKSHEVGLLILQNFCQLPC